MTIDTTLGEILSKGYDWDRFCRNKGYSEWAVNEGGGDVEIILTLDEAISYGLIREKDLNTINI